MKFGIKAVIFSLVCFSIQSSRAQLVSVDINGAARSDTTAPGFSAWNITAGSGTATQSFTNFVYTYDPDTGLPTSTNVGSVISCQLTQTVPSPSSTIYLKADYANKDGNTLFCPPSSVFESKNL